MNPFDYGRVVTGLEFFGREDLLRRLLSHIESGQNIVLFGERRMGKTSLVMEALNRQKRQVLHVDFSEVKTTDDVVSRVVQGLQKLEKQTSLVQRLMRLAGRIRGELSLTTDPWTNLPMAHIHFREKDPATTITGVLDLIEEIHKANPLAVFCDEFQGLLGLKEADTVLATMRASIQHQGRLPYIFAGSIRRKMFQIFMEPKAPFYKSALPIEVEPMPFKDISRMILEVFRKGERNVSAEHLREIYDIVYGNTGDLQQFCNALWNVTEPGDQVTQEGLNRALEELFATERPHYLEILKRLTGPQTKVLNGLAVLNGKAPFGARFREGVGGMSTSTIQKAIERLVKDEIIHQPFDSDDFRFYMPYFRLWLIRQNQVTIEKYPAEI